MNNLLLVTLVMFVCFCSLQEAMPLDLLMNNLLRQNLSMPLKKEDVGTPHASSL